MPIPSLSILLIWAHSPLHNFPCRLPRQADPKSLPRRCHATEDLHEDSLRSRCFFSHVIRAAPFNLGTGVVGLACLLISTLALETYAVRFFWCELIGVCCYTVLAQGGIIFYAVTDLALSEIFQLIIYTAADFNILTLIYLCSNSFSFFGINSVSSIRWEGRQSPSLETRARNTKEHSLFLCVSHRKLQRSSCMAFCQNPLVSPRSVCRASSSAASSSHSLSAHQHADESRDCEGSHLARCVARSCAAN